MKLVDATDRPGFKHVKAKGETLAKGLKVDNEGYYLISDYVWTEDNVVIHYLIVGLGLNYYGNKKLWGSYRLYDTKDNTYNHPFWALVCFGDYHNTHHTKPSQ